MYRLPVHAYSNTLCSTVLYYYFHSKRWHVCWFYPFFHMQIDTTEKGWIECAALRCTSSVFGIVNGQTTCGSKIRKILRIHLQLALATRWIIMDATFVFVCYAPRWWMAWRRQEVWHEWKVHCFRRQFIFLTNANKNKTLMAIARLCIGKEDTKQKSDCWLVGVEQAIANNNDN